MRTQSSVRSEGKNLRINIKAFRNDRDVISFLAIAYLSPEHSMLPLVIQQCLLAESQR